MNLIGNFVMKSERMSFITHIRNAVFVSSAKEKIALNLCRVCVIWTKEITETTAGSCIAQKHWRKVMIAAIFTLQG